MTYYFEACFYPEPHASSIGTPHPRSGRVCPPQLASCTNSSTRPLQALTICEPLRMPPHRPHPGRATSEHPSSGSGRTPVATLPPRARRPKRFKSDIQGPHPPPWGPFSSWDFVLTSLPILVVGTYLVMVSQVAMGYECLRLGFPRWPSHVSQASRVVRTQPRPNLMPLRPSPHTFLTRVVLPLLLCVTLPRRQVPGCPS